MNAARWTLSLVLAACVLTPLGWTHALPLVQASTSAPAGDLSVQRDRITNANTARKAGDYAAARAIALQVVTDLLAQPKPEQDAALLKLLDSAGRTAWDAHDVRTAESAWQRVYEVRSTILPDDDPNLQTARQNLAIAIAERGDLQGARALQEKVLEVRTRTLPEDDADLQRTRQNVAITMRKLGDLQGARALQEKVLEVRSRTLPDDNADLQAARANLAVTIRTLGDLKGAQSLQERVLDVFARTLSDDDPDLQGARASLAITMSKLGDLAGARALQEKVLEVFSRMLPDDTDTQVARGNLAATLWMLGDLQAARVLQEKVLEVLSRTMSDDNLTLQRARQNLALTLQSLGELEGARDLEEQVLEVRSRTLPDDDPDLQSARSNLAVTLCRLGDLAAARALQEKVLEVRSQSLPEDHPDLQLARQNLGATICRLGEIADARTLFEKVLEVSVRTLPDDHADLQAARQNVAATILSQRAREPRATGGAVSPEKERYTELLGSICRAQVHAARAAILESSSREAEERCANLAQQLDVSLSGAQGGGVFEPLRELERDSFVLSETTRGAALASAELTRRAAGSPKYGELRVALREASADFASLAQKGSTSEEFDRARVRRESAERELAALAQKLSGGRASGADLDVEALADGIAADQALVTFRRYAKGRMEVADELDSTGQHAVHEIEVASLCAFVVRGRGREAKTDTVNESVSTSPLALADLGPIEPIEAAARAWRAGLGVAEDSRGVTADAGEERASNVHAEGVRLRERIFDPLIPLLAGAQRVVVVLDDVLHLVPLDALPLDAETLVGDRWRIETRATLTELLSTSAPLEGRGAIVALGDADYGADTRRKAGDAAAPVHDAVETHSVARAGILRGSVWEQGFSALSGTGVEVRGIAQMFTDAFGADAAVELFQHAAASRESLLALASKARYLHVATHGWFAPSSIKSWLDPESIDKRGGLGVRMSGEETVKGMSPMLLCGLAFAGANRPDDAAARTPGLVTADELSTLDLSNCELAVLSACDTNVGERRAGQGVASLQKALQMAGARSVITSLWKVPDEATKDLMLDFYRRMWVEKKPKWQALWEAKSALRNAKDQRGSPKYTTRDWAAWVLTGNPD